MANFPNIVGGYGTYSTNGTDTFDYANVRPLNSAHWRNWQAAYPTNDVLEVVSDVCTTTTVDQSDGKAGWIGSALNTDQWCCVNSSRLGANGIIYLYCNAGTTGGPDYSCAIYGGGVGGPNYTIYQITADGGGVEYTWASNVSFSTSPGDVLGFARTTTSLQFWKNSTLVFSGLLSASPITLTGGTTGLQLTALDNNNTSVAVTNWKTGNWTAHGLIP